LAEVNGALGKLKGKTLGRPRRLDPVQCAALSKALLKGALHAGFPTELWTVKRVRALVKREFGVAYSNTGCWELLRSLGFSPQKPEKRALQRDESAIATWRRKTWPALKKTPNVKGEP
jgi:transposase